MRRADVGAGVLFEGGEEGGLAEAGLVGVLVGDGRGGRDAACGCVLKGEAGGGAGGEGGGEEGAGLGGCEC